jgi:hypothetical protein
MGSTARRALCAVGAAALVAGALWLGPSLGGFAAGHGWRAELASGDKPEQNAAAVRRGQTRGATALNSAKPGAQGYHPKASDLGVQAEERSRFGSAAEEIEFLEQRVRGEASQLENRRRSHQHVLDALAAPDTLSAEELSALAARDAKMSDKLALLEERIARYRERIETLATSQQAVGNDQ